MHRLDKGTSGLIVAAKTDEAHQGLARQFAAHGRDGKLHRLYLAFVWGAPRPAKGKIDAPIGRHPKNRQKFAVVARGGKQAVTHYETRKTYGRPPPMASLIACRLETGRTHQIRVHLAHQGHPLLGDPLYGAPRRGARAAQGLPALEARLEDSGAARRCMRRSSASSTRSPASGSPSPAPCRPISRNSKDFWTHYKQLVRSLIIDTISLYLGLRVRPAARPAPKAMRGLSRGLRMNRAKLPSIVSDGGLSRYLSEIRKFPMLEPGEEYMLAKRWREHEDAPAPRTSSSPAICASSPRSPWAIAATACRSAR